MAELSNKALMEYLKVLNTKIDSGGGGSGVPSSYNDLTDKPSIEGVTLIGNKAFPELNLDVLSNAEIEALLNN